jgi:tape measure domain-containing protein
MADYTLSAKITGDASGFKGMIASAQAGLDGLKSKVAEAGSKMESIGKSMSSVGDSLTNKITKPATVAAGALAGLALKKGFDRLTGIDDARAKLMGLGHDAGSVDKIMQSATASVKGTAFGMAEAATTAAGATAAGVKQGDELTRYLSLTADAAAIAGTSMSEMGSIVNKVTTSGRAMTENLEQLSDRGLPIYQWLGDAAGVAASDIKDMASSGEISSEMFMNAIEKNIGGAAQIMGQNSFKSTIANIGASIGRIGANFLDAGGKGGGFFSTLKPMLADFNKSLGAVEDIAAEMGVKFGDAFSTVVTKIQDLKDKFDGLSPTIQSVITKGALIGGAIAVGIGPALKIAGSLTTHFGGFLKVISLLFSPLGLVVAAIAALGVAFGVAMVKSESFRNKVSEIASSIGNTLSMVKLLAQGFLTMITSGPGEKIAALREQFITLFPEELWNKMIQFSSRINDIISVIKAFVGIINGSIGDIGALGETLDGTLDYEPEAKLFEIGTKVKEMFGNIKETITSFASTIGPYISSALSMIGPVFQTAFSAIGPAVTNVFNGLKPVFETIGGIVQAILPSIQNLISELGPKLQSGVGNSGGLISSIGMALLGVNPIIKMVISAFQMFGPQIVSMVQQVAPMLIDTIGVIAGAVIDLASSAIPLIMAAFQQFLPIVMQIGQLFMSSLAVILPVILNLITQLVPIVTSLAQSFMQVFAQVVPLIGQLVSALLPSIQNIITMVMNVVTTLAPAVVAVIQMIATVIQALLPVISSIIQVVINVVTNIISVINPIVGFISGLISTIIAVITPIITAIATIITAIVAVIRPIIATVTGIFNTVSNTISRVWQSVMIFTGDTFATIGSIISRISAVVQSVFNGIGGFISNTMDTVSDVISSTFSAIEGAWNGLTGFVGGVFGGISDAVGDLVGQVKGFVNTVIGGINSAIDIINKIPGVSIGEIPYLQSGTSSFQGGFARMNEGGRGELAFLPSGTQVIPHDVSMKYAKESAKRSAVTDNRVDNGSVVYDYRGMNDGATFIVREEADINKIAKALETKLTKQEKRLGVRRAL